MRKRYLVPNQSIPTNAESEEDLIEQLYVAGHLNGVHEELLSRPDGRIQVSVGLRGMYFWVESPDDPPGGSLIGFLMLAVYNLVVFSVIGWLLSYPDAWMFKGESRHELFAVRGACFGGIALLCVFVANRFDRVFTICQVLVCVAVMMFVLGVPLILLLLRFDWQGVLWVLVLAFLYRNEWNDTGWGDAGPVHTKP